MTNAKINGLLVSVQWLAENLIAENLVILDASMPPVSAVDSVKKHEKPIYIPGARRFDFDKEIRDKESHLPHMMPSPKIFTKEAQKLGINTDSTIVVYDNVGIYSSPRMWNQVAGGSSAFATLSSWVAGASTLKGASNGCSGQGLTGGAVQLTQYLSNGFDADYPC